MDTAAQPRHTNDTPPQVDAALACRACGARGLRLVLDLGVSPLANRLLTADQLSHPEPAYPLRVVFCPTCSLVQITETVAPEELFAEYLYFSSFSDTVVANARQVTSAMMDRLKLNTHSLAVEIASNDGYLLQFYQERGIPVLGIEPATNIARVAEAQRGIRTLNAFFGRETARALAVEGDRADVVHANNVLAHVADLNGFVEGLFTILKDDGVAVIEVPYLRNLIEGVEFDTIYHEHLCYFSLTALCRLFRRFALAIVDVERLPIHGGSLRIHAKRDPADTVRPSKTVNEMLQQEASLGMNDFAFYREFAARVERLKSELVDLLHRLKHQGKRIAVYGASAKGSTLLNFLGIGVETLDWVADRSTVKQGYYTPGTHLPIVSPERLVAEMPDYVLLLAWNFRDEILRQQQVYHDRGGKFIIPIPILDVV